MEDLLENERELLQNLTIKEREVLSDLLSKLVTEFDET
jgi:FixJ family two-component response regulator